MRCIDLLQQRFCVRAAASAAWLAGVLLFSMAGEAAAHKVNVFAYVEGDQVYVQGYFADGKLAKKSEVTVHGPDEQVLFKGVTDDKGELTFTPSRRVPLRIVLLAELGHQAEYRLSFEEAAVHDAGDEAGGTEGAAFSGDEAAMQRVVKKAVMEAMLPLAKELDELKQQRSFSDIIGGVGFIVGVLGVLAFFQARRAK